MEDQVQCLDNLSEYTGYCDHGYERPKNYSIKWRLHFNVRYPVYFRKPNKQFRGSRPTKIAAKNGIAEWYYLLKPIDNDDQCRLDKK